MELKWDDHDQTLTLSDRQGSYPGMVATHSFLVRILQSDFSWTETLLVYDGKRQTVS